MSAKIRKCITMLVYSISFIAAFAVVKIFFLLSDKNEFATYSLILSIAVTIRIFWHNIAQSTFARFWILTRDGERATAYAGLLRRVVVYPSMFSGIFWITAQFLPANQQLLFLPMTLREVSAGLVLGSGLGACAILADVDNVALNRLRSAIYLVVPGIVQIFWVSIGGRMNWGAVTISSLSGASLLVVSAVNYSQIFWSSKIVTGRNHERPSASEDDLYKEMLRFAMPMLIWSVPSMLQRAGDRWLLADRSTAEALAAYSVLLLLSQNVLQAAYTILNRTFLPIIFNARSEPGTRGFAMAHAMVNRLALAVFAVGFTMTLTYFFIGDEIITVASSNEIARYSYLLPVVTISATILVCADANILHGQLENQLTCYIAPRIISAVGYMVAGGVLMGKWGVSGLAVGLLASSAVAYVVSALVSRDIVRRKLALIDRLED